MNVRQGGADVYSERTTARRSKHIAIVARVAQFPKLYLFDDLLILSCVMYDAPICLRM